MDNLVTAEAELELPRIFTIFQQVIESDLTAGELEQLICMINGYRYSLMPISEVMRLLK